MPYMNGKRKRSGGSMETRAIKCRTMQLLHELQTNELGASAKIIDAPPRRGDISTGIMRELPLDKLPEDILHRVYSLMPLKDAVRAACVSHGFLRCWRRYPILILNNKTIGLIMRKLSLDDMESYAVSKIDHIIKSHSGIGVKVLKLQLFACPNISAAVLDKWFVTVIKPGIEELSLEMSSLKKRTVYNFPCSVLSNKAGGGTIRSLFLSSCAFHPTVTLGCNRSLTSLHLCKVDICGEELGQFLSNSFSLERLVISDCSDIIKFKVPCLMQQLKYLEVTKCQMLQVIEIDAPKLSTFIYGDVGVKISLGDPLQVKDIRLMGYNEADIVCYARTKLPSILPNIESLIVSSPNEMISTPMVPIKFLHLKLLEIYLAELLAFPPNYDFFSLVSFLDGSPALETFILHVKQRCERRDSILDGEHTNLRQILHPRHANLQNVTITGFNSTKSMIELTSHILENAPSLKCITLDTANFYDKNLLTMGECLPMRKGGILEARKAFDAAKRYIAGKVPSHVEYKFLEPCRKFYHVIAKRSITAACHSLLALCHKPDFYLLSLECITLDTAKFYGGYLLKIGKCLRMSKEALIEAHKAHEAVRRCIEEEAPSFVKLKVQEPCRECNSYY
uniref:F-box domain-containing protein n=1 Tax=Oryza barthii TaxID=65489 RepID=A0A0D3G0N2_9ORYZ